MSGSTAIREASPRRETLELPEEALRAAYLAASRLMDSLLHDARNPLNAVAINLEVLTEKLKDDEGRLPEAMERNIKAMREQIYRVDAILREFADFIAPRPGAPGDLDLGQLLPRALEVVGHDARKHRAKVRESIAPAVARVQDAAAAQLLIVQALLRAILRSEGAEISVCLSRDQDAVALSVEGSAGEDPQGAAVLAAFALRAGAGVEVSPGRVCIRFPSA